MSKKLFGMAVLVFAVIGVMFSSIVNVYAEASLFSLGDAISDMDNWVTNGPELKDTIVGDTIVMGKDTGIGYMGKAITDETVAFNSVFKFDPTDGWVAFMLKGPTPQNAMWGNGKNYCILLRQEGVIELQKWNDGTPKSLLTNTVEGLELSDGNTHAIKYSAVDNVDSVIITFNVDGNDVLVYEDKDNPFKGEGYFGAFCYLYSKAALSAITEEAASGEKVEEPVQQNESTENPETGDVSMLYFAAMAGAGASILIMLKKKN